MGQFKPDLYEQIFESWDDPVMEEHRRDEMKIVRGVKESRKKTFIDLGAGYGRVMPDLVQIALNVIAVDIDVNMFDGLKKRSQKYNNFYPVSGDICKLSKVLLQEELNIQNPVAVILENTMGTIKGDWKDVVSEMKIVMYKYKGEVIVSLYRQKALRDWGIKSYWEGVEMNGEPDFEKTNFEKGLFVSKTGYTSKWWTDKEISDMKEYFGGKLLNEIITDHYWIFHIGKGEI